MRRRTHPTAIQADRDTRSCHVPRRSRWGTVRWRGFECFVPSPPPPRAPAISRTSDAPLLLDRRGWLLWAGSRGRVSCWPAIVATTAFFLSHCPHHQTQSHFSRRGGRATSSLRSTNKSPVTSSHFPTTSCQNLWLSPRFPSILVHQELGASWWLRRADGAATRGPLPCPVGCLRNLTPGLALHREGCPAAGWDPSSRASKRTSSCSSKTPSAREQSQPRARPDGVELLVGRERPRRPPAGASSGLLSRQ